METNSLTGDTQVQTASEEPTVVAQETQTTAEEVNQQETSPAVNPAESVSDDTASTQETEEKQTEETGGQSQADDGIAKFAKSQGFDPDNLTDDLRKALKIAHDNQKFARSQKVAESKASVDGDVTRDELESFRSEFRHYQAQKQAEQFFSQEGRDDSLAPIMSEIIEEKKAAHGVEFARVLANDLETLYGLAQLKSGSVSTGDLEQARREERESINSKMAAGANSQHATNSSVVAPVVVDRAWFANEYDPNNEEHQKMRDEFFAQ